MVRVPYWAVFRIPASDRIGSDRIGSGLRVSKCDPLYSPLYCLPAETPAETTRDARGAPRHTHVPLFAIDHPPCVYHVLFDHLIATAVLFGTTPIDRSRHRTTPT